MSILDFVSNLWVELTGGIIIIFLSFVASNLPKSISRMKAKRFFGAALNTEDIHIVHGFYSAIKKEGSKSTLAPRCEKRYVTTKENIKMLGPGSYTSIHDIRALSYILQEITKYRKKNLPLITDNEALKNLTHTFISIGGPLVNEITYLALQDKNNIFGKFNIPEDFASDDPFSFDIFNNSKIKFIREQTGSDIGVLLKIKNSRNPRNNFFVCSGIASWGTSGAAWYLSHHWKSLYKEFKQKDFIVIVEVLRGSDESAKRVFPKSKRKVP